MKNTGLMLFLACVCHLVSWAQEAPSYIIKCPFPEEEEFDSSVVVVARSGLKLREKPAFSAKTLALMPFAQKVQLLELPRFSETGDLIGTWSPDSIYGAWLKVRWGKRVGYAFSAYLGSTILNMTEDFYLLSAKGSWCSDDSYFSSTYHYYGVFPEKDSTWVRRAVQPAFTVHWSGMFGVGNYAKLKVKGPQPLFLLASRRPMPEGPIPASNRRGYLPGNPTQGKPLAPKTSPISPWTFEIKSFPDENGQPLLHTILKNSDTGQKQSLAAEPFPPDYLVWEGDLDGDGIPDLILSDFKDIVTTWHLYLSSGAPAGQLLHQVSDYYFSGCC